MHVLKSHRIKRIAATSVSAVNNSNEFVPENVTSRQTDLLTYIAPVSHNGMGKMAFTVLIGGYIAAIGRKTKDQKRSNMIVSVLLAFIR